MTISWEEQGHDVYRNTLQITNQGTNTVGCLSQEGRHQTHARMFMIGVMIHWQKHAGLMAHKLWGKKLWGNRGCWWQEGEWQMFTNLPTFASRERDCMCFLLSRCKMASLRSAGQVVLKWVSPQWTLALKGCSHYKGLGLYSVHDTTDRPKRSFEQIPLSRDFSLST